MCFFSRREDVGVLEANFESSPESPDLESRLEPSILIVVVVVPLLGTASKWVRLPLLDLVFLAEDEKALLTIRGCPELIAAVVFDGPASSVPCPLPS